MIDTVKHEIPLAEAAQRLAVSWSKAWRLMLEGVITGRKVNGRWHVQVEDVDRLVEQNKSVEPTTAVPA